VTFWLSKKVPLFLQKRSPKYTNIPQNFGEKCHVTLCLNTKPYQNNIHDNNHFLEFFGSGNFFALFFCLPKVFYKIIKLIFSNFSEWKFLSRWKVMNIWLQHSWTLQISKRRTELVIEFDLFRILTQLT